MARVNISWHCKRAVAIVETLLLLLVLLQTETAMAAGGEKGAYYDIAPVQIRQKELRMTLYMKQITSGSGQNQLVVVPRDSNYFGTVVATDWTVFDGAATSTANLVGNAQGFHMNGSMDNDSWSFYFDLVFKNGRFEGSTLKLLGSFGPAADGEWAVVGGTGEFTLAQGVISHKKVLETSDRNTRELKFRVFYTPIKV